MLFAKQVAHSYTLTTLFPIPIYTLYVLYICTVEDAVVRQQHRSPTDMYWYIPSIYEVFVMAYQAIANQDDRSWDSIRDGEREALFKVAEYMSKDIDSEVVMAARTIKSKLIFGIDIETIKQLLQAEGFTITIKYIR